MCIAFSIGEYAGFFIARTSLISHFNLGWLGITLIRMPLEQAMAHYAERENNRTEKAKIVEGTISPAPHYRYPVIHSLN